MIIIFAVLLALALPTHEQSTPISPCPNVFSYEPPGSEPGRWYGVVNLSTDSTLHSLWLNIVLDSKADILGNWIGDVSTTDNIDFKIENTDMKINPGPALAVRFFVQYNPLNKTPRLKAIRLNGRQICDANTPQPTNNIASNTNTRPSRPTTSRPHSTLPSVRPEDRPETRPVQSRPQQRPSEGPVYVRPPNQPSPSSIDGGESPSQNVNKGTQTQQRPTYNNNNNNNNNNNYDFTTAPPRRTTTRRQRPDIPDFDNDNVSNGDDRDAPHSSDYFTGGQITFTLPSSSSTNSNKKPEEPQCGKVTLNNPIPLVVNGTPTLEGQWPWQIALYQTQTVDNKYICGGTLVSHRHIITAAHCVTLKGSRRVVNKNTLTVYLGKHNLRTSVDGVQIRFVDKITVHPDYNATIFSRDLAVLTLREPVSYTDWVRPACLWPDNQQDLSYVVGKKGSVVGWGYDDTGVATEELTLVEMPVVSQETCIRSYSEFFVRFTSEYTYCAGFRDGIYNQNTGTWERTSVCNGDSGGGMVLKLGNTWYVRGLVSVSVARENEYRCDPSHYVIFTDLAKFLPWIRRQVSDY